jgi:site-specific recombinase XerD
MPRGKKGQRYPADSPTVDEIVAVMRQAGDTRYGNRLKALIVVLWRAGLRINEALSLTATDLDQRHGSILVRHGKNDRHADAVELHEGILLPLIQRQLGHSYLSTTGTYLQRIDSEEIISTVTRGARR